MTVNLAFNHIHNLEWNHATRDFNRADLKTAVPEASR
jgi:hypothetical protein